MNWNPFRDRTTETALAAILYSINSLNLRIIKMASTVDTLVAEVAAQTTVIGSAVTLLKDLHDRLVAAGTDPAALAALATTIQSNTDALAAAVQANTTP